MATIKTTQHGNSYCPQVQFEVTESSSTGGAVTYAWTLKWVTFGYTVTSSASKAYTAKIDGATVASGSFAIGGKSSTTIASGTYTINKGTSSRSVAIYLSFAMTFTWSGTSGGTKTASGSFTIAAKDSYTVSYNVNGGSGSFANQTKWYGTNLTLHSGSPSRTGHNFVRWNTNTSNTGTGYAPGGTYTGNAALTLYAIWSAHTYTVSYNLNGGSGSFANQTKTYGKDLTLHTGTPTRTNYNFLGWSTSASGGVVYAAGATYTANSAVTLYAVWQLAYWKPNSYNYTAYRCDSAGNASETGTYLRVIFDWSTFYNVYEIWIDWSTQSNFASFSNAQASGSGSTSGRVDVVVGNGGISIENTYYVRGWINDNTGSSYTITASIGTVKFPIDVKSGGTGVAIGKVAETDNLFDVNYPAIFRQPLTGPLSFANGTWNPVGDDVAMGDYNAAGLLGIKGLNGNTGIGFYPYSGSTVQTMVANGSGWLTISNNLKVNDCIRSNNTYYTGDVITGASGSARWVKIGTWYSNGDASNCCIRVFSGNGYNAGPSQNTMITIVIKDSWQASASTTGAFGIRATPNMIGDTSWIGMAVRGIATAYNVIDVWLYLPWAYWNGNYIFEGQGSWARSRDVSTSEPSGVAQSMDWEFQHKIGTVIITSSNSNPHSTYGGTWELIDKEFASGDNIGSWSHNTSNCSSSDFDFSRAGHTIMFSGGFTSAIQWNDDDVHVGTVDFASCGISRLGADVFFVAYTDAGNSGLMCRLSFETGQLTIHDNFGDSYISASRYCRWTCTVTVPMAYMLDAACNKFYWKRTA